MLIYAENLVENKNFVAFWYLNEERRNLVKEKNLNTISKCLPAIFKCIVSNRLFKWFCYERARKKKYMFHILIFRFAGYDVKLRQVHIYFFSFSLSEWFKLILNFRFLDLCINMYQYVAECVVILYINIT